MSLTSQQLRYLDALLDKSEEDLLYEVARGITLGITNSTGYHHTRSNPRPPSEDERIQVRGRVPDAPITEYHKPGLKGLLAHAKEKALATQSRLYELLCDASIKQPKAWAVDAATGQVKDVAAGVIGALTAQYSIAMSIAIPVVVLALKKGLYGFCATQPLA